MGWLGYSQRLPYFDFQYNQVMCGLLWQLNWVSLCTIVLYATNSSHSQGVSFLFLVGSIPSLYLAYLFLHLRRLFILKCPPKERLTPFDVERTASPPAFVRPPLFCFTSICWSV